MSDGTLTADATCAVTVVASSPTTTLADIRAAGYVVATDYAVDPTGQSDSTVGLQAAINAAFTAFKPLYIPSGTYLVSDTLRLYHWNNYNKDETRSHIIQGCTTSPPVIKLKANATGFTSVATPRPVICERAFQALNASAVTDAIPSDPFGLPANYRDQSGMVVTARMHSVTVDTNGNAGAVGIAWTTAQMGNTAHLKVIATGSFAGMCGTGGTTGTSNLEIIGGQYGLYYQNIRQADFNSGTYVSGFKLTGQTVANIAVGDFSPQAFVGGYCEMPPGGSVMKWIPGWQNNGTRNATPVMIDTVVVATTDDIAFPVPDRTVYLRNVYVKGTTKLIRPNDTASVYTGTGTWKLIREHSQAVTGTLGNASGALYTYAYRETNLPHRAVIDGVFQPTLAYLPTPDIVNSAPAPASLTMYVEQHSHPQLPCIDNGPYIDVTKAPYAAPRLQFTYFGKAVYDSAMASLPYGDYTGATYPQNRPVDAAPAINAAIVAAEAAGHNRVFLPRGIYYISSPINLRANTQLFGVGSEKTTIACMWDWEPTSQVYMVQSANDANGRASMSDFLLFHRKVWGTKYVAPGGLVDNLGNPCYLYPYDYFGCVLWRTGRRSWTHGVDTKAEWANQYWPAQPRQKWTFTGNGGGRHWFVYADGRSNCAAEYRLVLANGTTQPLAFYAINAEAGKGVNKGYGYDVQANIEIRNASNVRVYGTKREGNGATMWINGNAGPCRNVADYGSGVQQIWPFASGNPYGDNDAAFFAVTGDVNGALIAVSTVQQLDTSSGVNLNRLMLKEAVTGQAKVRIYWPEGISLYKRGALDDSAMNHS